MLFGSVKVSKVKPQHPAMHIFYWQKNIKALRKHLKTKQNGRSTCILLFLAKDMFLVLAEENIQQYSLPKTGRHDLPRHADPQNKSALASTGYFHAFFFFFLSGTILTLGDCMTLRLLIGYRAFHL